MFRQRLVLLAWLGATLACTARNPDYHPGAGPGGAGGEDVARMDAAAGGDDGKPDLGADLASDPASEPAPGDAPAGPPDAEPPGLGAACSTGAGCASGNCVHGICCNTDCRQRCWSCGLPGSLGTCTATPAGDDPHDDCAAESPSTCGRTGACDGVGNCTLHPTGTECRAPTCAAGVETAANLCDGTGRCMAGATRACPLVECTADQCAVECSTTVPCASGSQCVSGRCTGNGPTLYWRFDEPSGIVATDASGNGLHGSYLGEPTAPQPSTNVPATMFPNPRSRSFASSGRPGATLATLDGRLLPANNVSLALWFRATTVTSDGSDVISIGGDILLRVRRDRIEFAKHKSASDGSQFAVAAANDVTGHLDGRWHHLAGVISTKGLDIYIDGILRNHDVDTQSVLYRPAPALWVGRAGTTTTHDFSGTIDDVRIYTRALGGAEIAALFRGAP
jgi:hypothetical protein